MSITEITPITATPPDRSQPAATFNANASATLAAQKLLTEELVVSIPEMNTDISGVAASATAADASATAAAASANSLGEWSALTGAVNVPASVTHSSQIWILDTNLADVTTSEPGVSGDWTKLVTTNVVAGSTQDFTASGAITIGDAVARNAATSTVSTVGRTTVAPTANTEVTFEAGSMTTRQLSTQNGAWSVADSVYVIAYSDPDDSQTYCAAATVSAAGVIGTFGTPKLLYAGESAGQCCVYDETYGQMIVIFTKADSTSTCVALTISGTTITLGSEVVTSGFGSNDYTAFWLDTSTDGKGRIIVDCSYVASGDQYYVGYITNDAGTLAFSMSQIEANASSQHATIKAAGGKWIMAWRDEGDSNRVKWFVEGFGKLVVMTGGTKNDTYFSKHGTNHLTGFYDENTGRSFIIYYDTTDSVFNYYCIDPQDAQIYGGNYDGSRWTRMPKALSGITSVSELSCVFDPSRSQVYLVNTVGGAGNASRFSVNKNELEFIETSAFNATATSRVGGTWCSEHNIPIFHYEDNDDTNKGKAVTMNVGYTESNASDFVGFANATVLDAATVEVQTSSTGLNQTGLTVGQDYWLHPDGTYKTYSTGAPYLGRAISTTSIDQSAPDLNTLTVSYATAACSFQAGDSYFIPVDGIAAKPLGNGACGRVSTGNINTMQSSTQNFNNGSSAFAYDPHGGQIMHCWKYTTTNDQIYYNHSALDRDTGALTLPGYNNGGTFWHAAAMPAAGSGTSVYETMDACYNPYTKMTLWVGMANTTTYFEMRTVNLQANTDMGGSSLGSGYANNQPTVEVDPETGQFIVMRGGPTPQVYTIWNGKTAIASSSTGENVCQNVGNTIGYGTSMAYDPDQKLWCAMNGYMRSGFRVYPGGCDAGANNSTMIGSSSYSPYVQYSRKHKKFICATVSAATTNLETFTIDPVTLAITEIEQIQVPQADMYVTAAHSMALMVDQVSGECVLLSADGGYQNEIDIDNLEQSFRKYHFTTATWMSGADRKNIKFFGRFVPYSLSTSNYASFKMDKIIFSGDSVKTNDGLNPSSRSSSAIGSVVAQGIVAHDALAGERVALVHAGEVKNIVRNSNPINGHIYYHAPNGEWTENDTFKHGRIGVASSDSSIIVGGQ
tara:strand:+ start:2493 stop:5870 length:3378 start_codon:yes stop_codon:yes gene_type:complete